MKNRGNIILIAFLLALIVRILVILLFNWDKGLHFETALIAKNIVAGHGYSWDWYGKIPLQPTATFPPIYTYFIAFFIAIFDQPARYIYIAQAILNSLGVIPCYYIGKHLMDDRGGAISAILYAIFPELAFTPARMVAEPLILPLISLAIFLYLKFKVIIAVKDSARYFILLGIILGIGALMKANVSLVFLSCIIALFLSRLKMKSAVRSAIFLTSGFMIIISPWSIRCSVLYDKPVLLRTMYGYNLWRGNHPGASGTARLDEDTYSEANLSEEYIRYIDSRNFAKERDIDEFYMNEAVRFIKNDMSTFVKLSLKRVFYFITIDPTHPLTKNPIYRGGYIFIVIFGIWGAIKLNRVKKLDCIFIILPISFIVFYSPVMILPRYRLTGILDLLILSSVAVSGVTYRIPVIWNKVRNYLSAKTISISHGAGLNHESNTSKSSRKELSSP